MEEGWDEKSGILRGTCAVGLGNWRIEVEAETCCRFGKQLVGMARI